MDLGLASSKAGAEQLGLAAGSAGSGAGAE